MVGLGQGGDYSQSLTGGGYSQSLTVNLRSDWPVLTLHQKRIACGAVYNVSTLCQYDNAFGDEESESDMDNKDDYIYTCTFSFSCSSSFSLTHSLSLVLSFFVLCLSFGVSLRVGCEFLHVSWLKALFLMMFEKVNIDLNIHVHPLTVSSIFNIKQMSHTHPVLVRYQAKKTPKSHANTLYAMTLSLRSKKKSPAAQTSIGSARLLHWSECSKPVRNHFLKNL